MIDATYTLEQFTASDGYVWKYRKYQAAVPRAHVVCLHGIQSHAGWYEYSCQRLAEAGFTVSFLERRGSGLNERDRGDTPSFRRLLDDIAEFLRPLRQNSLPVFLAAISWGGKLAVALQRRHPGLVDGLALLCPGFCPRVGVPFPRQLAILWARFVVPKKKFPIPLNEPDLFTANPKWLAFLRDDPLALHEASARFLLESARLDGYVRLCPKKVQVPVLLMLAEKDRIIDNHRTCIYVHKFASEDKTIREYAGAHHTLEFESEPERFVHDLIEWLEAHIH